jgi:hypothetical protein
MPEDRDVLGAGSVKARLSVCGKIRIPWARRCASPRDGEEAKCCARSRPAHFDGLPRIAAMATGGRR